MGDDAVRVDECFGRDVVTFPCRPERQVFSAFSAVWEQNGYRYEGDGRDPDGSYYVVLALKQPGLKIGF